MSEGIYAELYIICKAVLLGAGLRAVYDVLRIIRRVFKKNNIVVGVEDLLFWALSGVMIFLMAYDFNGGSVSGYFYCFVFLGMMLYHVSVSNVFVKYNSLILLKMKFFVLKLLKKIHDKVIINKKRKEDKIYEQKDSKEKKK